MSIVTCGRPIQGGVNSGRKVMITSTRSVGSSIDDQVERLARGRVAPVHVLQHHQHGLPRRQSLDLRQLAPEASSPCASAG